MTTKQLCVGCGYQTETAGDVATFCPGCGAMMVAVPSAETLADKGQPKMSLHPGGLKPKAKSPKATTWQAHPGLSPKAKVTPDSKAGHPPETQKAKGIHVLQVAGHLPKAYARIVLTESQALEAAQATGYPCFVRPCPITPRHGFVDSRVVKSGAEVREVWGEAVAADPKAEMIVMPFIEASHNMVWRPGLLSVGPGHDGATAGHDSVSVFLQAGYSATWKALATQAGCDLDETDPFIEAVASPSADMVLTQIRAGVKGTPTAPDWNPHDMATVGEVVTIDPAHKADPGAMLQWETTAKGLTPGYHVVWNPGGNLGDHWSVHAQLASVAVVTSFKPEQGSTLPKMGEDLVPLEPQAIIFGYLGGLLAPSLTLPVQRKRAVCAALLGSHHGLRMGGDAGVFIGASVAMMLRLAQAAIWGESRHKVNPGKLSRDQVYQSILDDWYKGRTGLQKKGDLFFTHSWNSGYGGPAWGACSQATADLDRSMLELIKSPTGAGAEHVLATLTNVVNLAHNNGWWLNKFCDSTWFDMAADLDPRVAMMAGPIWYDAMTAPMEARMALLALIEKLEPADFTKHGVEMHAKLAKPSKSGHGAITPVIAPTPQTATGKISQLPPVASGGTVTLPLTPVKVQAKVQSATQLHVQVAVNDKGGYVTVPLVFTGGIPSPILSLLTTGQQAGSMAGTSTQYAVVSVDGGYLRVGGFVLAHWTVKE